jgi:hypothetical protein
MFEGTPVASHLVIDDQIFVNARDKTDPGMEQIKKTIIQQAKHQPTWGQTLPKCFLPLELEIAALVRKGVALITMDDMIIPFLSIMSHNFSFCLSPFQKLLSVIMDLKASIRCVGISIIC